jgi:hypothetical protein
MLMGVPPPGGRGCSTSDPQPADLQESQGKEGHCSFNKAQRCDSRMNDFRRVHAVEGQNVGLDVGDLLLGERTGTSAVNA